MDRFTEAKMLELAEAYRAQELLWKVNHDKYKDRLSRNNAYQEMVDRLKIPGLNVAILIRKIKNLRSSYYHELKRIEQGAKNGYKPKVAWFSVVDSFLKPYHCIRPQFGKDSDTMKSENSNNSADFDGTNSPFFHDDGEIGSEAEESKFDVLGDANENIGTSQYFVQVEQEEPLCPDFVDTTSIPSSSKKRKLGDLNEAIEKLDLMTQKLLDDSQNSDEYDIFGKYVAYTLRNLSRENAIKAKRDVQEVIAAVQLQDFQENVSFSQ